MPLWLLSPPNTNDVPESSPLLRPGLPAAPLPGLDVLAPPRLAMAMLATTMMIAATTTTATVELVMARPYRRGASTASPPPRDVLAHGEGESVGQAASRSELHSAQPVNAIDSEDGAQVVIITRHARPGTVKRAPATHVRAFVPKSTPASEIAARAHDNGWI